MLKDTQEIDDLIIQSTVTPRKERRIRAQTANWRVERIQTSNSKIETENHEIKKICSSCNIELDGQHLGRIAFYDDLALVSDYPNHALKIINLDKENFKPIKSEYFDKPWCVAVSNNKNIIVSDLVDNRICIFDNTMKTLIREFKTRLRASNVTIDTTSKKDYIYVSHWIGNEITIYDGESGLEKELSIKVDSPIYMAFSKKHVYVVSYTEFAVEPETNKFLKYKKGSNCIYKLKKKKPFDVENVFSFDNWISPVGIHVDLNGNIFTTAFKLNKNKKVSKNRFLFIINSEGNLIGNVELFGIGFCNSIAIDDRKVIVSNDSMINYFKFA